MCARPILFVEWADFSILHSFPVRVPSSVLCSALGTKSHQINDLHELGLHFVLLGTVCAAGVQFLLHDGWVLD